MLPYKVVTEWFDVKGEGCETPSDLNPDEPFWGDFGLGFRCSFPPIVTHSSDGPTLNTCFL